MTDLQIGTAGWFLDVLERVHKAGYAHETDWSEGLRPPQDANALAAEAIFVICNSGMRAQIARGIYDRVMISLQKGQPVAEVFGHKGKAAAIELIWSCRASLLTSYQQTEDKVAWCYGIPWIGNITKWHLAKNLGVDVVKPDRHLVRLAAAAGCSCDKMCKTIADWTGYRVATVDVVLWRACNLGIIDSAAVARSAPTVPQTEKQKSAKGLVS